MKSLVWNSNTLDIEEERRDVKVPSTICHARIILLARGEGGVWLERWWWEAWQATFFHVRRAAEAAADTQPSEARWLVSGHQIPSVLNACMQEIKQDLQDIQTETVICE